LVSAWEHPSAKQRRDRRSTKWDFYAASGDQGLLLYWTKYHKKNVSIIFRKDGIVKNIGPHPTEDMSHVEEVLVDPFKYAPDPVRCWGSSCKNTAHPLKDFDHFIASTKPWVRGVPPLFKRAKLRYASPVNLWYAILADLDRDYNMGINFKQNFPNLMLEKKDPPHRNEAFAKSRRQLPDYPLTNLLEQ